MPITSEEEYYTALGKIEHNRSVILETNKGTYTLKSAEDIGIEVYDAPTTNLHKGLDLQGGTRVLLQPERALDEQEMELVIDVLKQRLNVFGLSDIIIREAKDLSGDQFVLVEIAGANQKEVQELIEKQGKFEAKIANQTVFTGGNDVTYVCRGATCAGINPQRGCNQVTTVELFILFLNLLKSRSCRKTG